MQIPRSRCHLSRLRPQSSEHMDKQTALFSAIEANDVDAVRLLLVDPLVDPNFLRADQARPLDLAWRTSEEISLLLLDDPRQTSLDTLGLACHIATSDMNEEGARLFLTLVRRLGSDAELLIDATVLWCGTDAMRVLISEGILDNTGDYHLLLVSSHDSHEILQLYIETGKVDLTASGARLFDDAAKDNAVGMMKLLLASPDTAPTYECMHNAVTRDSARVLKLLLEDGRVDPSHNDNELLLFARQHLNWEDGDLNYGDYQEVLSLLERDTRVMAKCKHT